MGDLDAESIHPSQPRARLAASAACGAVSSRRVRVSFLPVTKATPDLTLFEGDTPLLSTPRLARWVGTDELWVKFEGMNPTGSFKDRGMVVAVAKAIERGIDTVLCASTGNTAASAAAYAARAGVRAVVLLPRGGVAGAKVSQALAYGARAVIVDGNFDAALDAARKLTDRYPMELVNSVNPHRIAGQATAAFEICDTLDGAPDLLALPVGNGGNISAYWAGFSGIIGRVEPTGCRASLVRRPPGPRPWSAGGRSSTPTRSRVRSASAGPPAGTPRWQRRVSRAVHSCPCRTTTSWRPTVQSVGWKGYSASRPPPLVSRGFVAASRTGRRPAACDVSVCYRTWAQGRPVSAPQLDERSPVVPPTVDAVAALLAQPRE